MKRSISTAEACLPAIRQDRPGWTRALRHACFLAAVSFTQACSGADDADPITQGGALYETNCGMCHGESALGDGPMAAGLPVPPPALFEHLGHHTRTHLIQLIATGMPPAMPPTALSDEEIGLVVDYLWSLVPEDEVAELRAMQEQMEMMDMDGDMDMESIPGMESDTMPSMEMEETQ